jgi:tripartite ATP-independent transporter DctM subunit
MCIRDRFMAWILILCRRRPELAPRPEAPAGLGVAGRSLVEIWPLAVLILAVLGSLFAGLATPTEAAAVGVAATILLGFTRGSLTLVSLAAAFVSTARTFAVIGMVFMGAIVLAQAIPMLGLPQTLLETVRALGWPPTLTLAIVVLVFLALGCFFDGLSMMIMTLPVVYPLFTGLGFDPVWLGVAVTLMIELGMLTPPVGMNQFVLVGITRNEVPLGAAARAAVPYWLALLLGVVLLTLAPPIATWLPRLAYG